MQNVGAAEIRDGAVEEGMLTLRMDGLAQGDEGITHARAGDPRDAAPNGQPVRAPAAPLLQRSSRSLVRSAVSALPGTVISQESH